MAFHGLTRLEAPRMSLADTAIRSPSLHHTDSSEMTWTYRAVDSNEVNDETGVHRDDDSRVCTLQVIGLQRKNGHLDTCVVTACAGSVTVQRSI